MTNSLDSGSTRPILVFTWGNPSRGDDAIGPYLDELLHRHDLPAVDLLTDFQLQIEHVVDLEHRERILFVDASVTSEPPFEYQSLQPEEDSSYTTHAMSPSALLSVYRRVNQTRPPPADLLSIRGYEFGLGLPLSNRARENTHKAMAFILDLIAKRSR
jgi:hydrogenase maturation protease